MNSDHFAHALFSESKIKLRVLLMRIQYYARKIHHALYFESNFDNLLLPYRVRTDKIMVGVNVFLLFVCLTLVHWYRSSYAPAILIGLPILLISIWLARQHAGKLMTRLFMACGFMAYTALIIHSSHGDIEAHSAAFGLIGVLLYYRDWRVIVAATLFIYLHHLVLGYAQALGFPVYVFDDNHFWLLFSVHITYFLPFIVMMLYLAIWLRRDGYESQHVIALARRIIEGCLTENDEDIIGEQHNMPLINAVRMMKSRLLDLLHIIPVATVVVRIDNDSIVSCNEAWQQLIGVCNDHCSCSSNKPFAQSALWTDKNTWTELLTRLYDSPTKQLSKEERILHKSNGTTMLCELSLTLHEDMIPVMAILTIEDISSRRKIEQSMHHLAYRDMLTDLPNRVSLQHDLAGALAKWTNEKIPFALVMMDLDGFKPINDKYGHKAGDDVLKIIAKRLVSINRECDLVARLGGDEFVVVLHNCPNAETTYTIAERFINIIAQPIHLTEQLTVHIGASAGIAHVQDEQDTIDLELISKKADIALYEAKTAGKNRVVLFKQLTQTTKL